jgi:hypothetical protein
MTFKTWFTTFISEKNVNLDEVIEVEGPSGLNVMPLQIVTDTILNQCGSDEQNQIKKMLIAIDFRNGDVSDYFKHLAQAIAL